MGFEKNGFFFCRNKEIFENWNGSMERVSFNIKRIRNGRDSFLKETLKIQCLYGKESTSYI